MSSVLFNSIFTTAAVIILASFVIVVVGCVSSFLKGKRFTTKPKAKSEWRSVQKGASSNAAFRQPSQFAYPYAASSIETPNHQCEQCAFCIGGVYCKGGESMCALMSLEHSKNSGKRLKNRGERHPTSKKTAMLKRVKTVPVPAALSAKDEDKIIHSAFHSDLEKLEKSIANISVKMKIHSIINISDKIAAKVENDGDEQGKTHNFNSYYMPTTLKLLTNYQHMEAQGVKGENIAQTMKNTEGMLDTVLKAFQKMLDALFASNALDVETDIDVMKTVMAREGLADNNSNFMPARREK